MVDIEIVVSIKVDGVELYGEPVRRRLTVTGVNNNHQGQYTTSSSYQALAGPGQHLDFLFLRADQLITLRTNNQSTAGIPINPQGFVLIVDSTIDTGTFASIQNNSGSSSSVDSVLGGL